MPRWGILMDFRGCDNPQNYGGAQAALWHGADGHPLIERCPADSGGGLVHDGS